MTFCAHGINCLPARQASSAADSCGACMPGSGCYHHLSAVSPCAGRQGWRGLHSSGRTTTWRQPSTTGTATARARVTTPRRHALTKVFSPSLPLKCMTLYVETTKASLILVKYPAWGFLACPGPDAMHHVSFQAELQNHHRTCHCLQLEACLQRMLHQQLSLAFNAMRDSAQKARHKRRALAFWTQRSLAEAFLAFRCGQHVTSRHRLQSSGSVGPTWSGLQVV